MKKFYFSLMLFSLSASSQAQPLNTAFGQNANLTDTVGTNLFAGGKLQNYWQTSGALAGQNAIQTAFVQFMRYGGIQVEEDCLIDGDPTVPTSNIGRTIEDYFRKAKYMQNNGMTPMMTLPYYEPNPNLNPFAVNERTSYLTGDSKN
jgi:hypothetical protein